MKITAIETFHHEAPLSKPISDARNDIKGRSCTLVRVSTDAGLQGWGEAASFAGAGRLVAKVIEQLKDPFFIGKDPLMTSALYDNAYHYTQHYGRRGLVISALSGIDIALWDILGKASNMPLYKLLGASRDRVKAYFNSGYYLGDDRAASRKHLDLALKTALDKKTRALKIKIGRHGLADDAERIAVAREALGAERDLMVDANGTLDKRGLMRLDDVMVERDVRWVEEPVSLRRVELLKRLAERIRTPIAGYELEMTLQGYAEQIEAGVVDIVQPDTIWSGGFTECRRIAAVAQAHETELIPHNFASIVSLAANAHLAASAKTGGWLEVDSNENPFLWPLADHGGFELQDGCVVLPEKPGLGVEPKLDAISKHRVTL